MYEKIKIKLLSSDGRSLRQWNDIVKNELVVDMKDYPSGFYLIEIKVDGQYPYLFKVGKI